MDMIMIFKEADGSVMDLHACCDYLEQAKTIFNERCWGSDGAYARVRADVNEKGYIRTLYVDIESVEKE